MSKSPRGNEDVELEVETVVAIAAFLITQHSPTQGSFGALNYSAAVFAPRPRNLFINRIPQDQEEP